MGGVGSNYWSIGAFAFIHATSLIHLVSKQKSLLIFFVPHFLYHDSGSQFFSFLRHGFICTPLSYLTTELVKVVQYVSLNAAFISFNALFFPQKV